MDGNASRLVFIKCCRDIVLLLDPVPPCPRHLHYELAKRVLDQHSEVL